MTDKQKKELYYAMPILDYLGIGNSVCSSDRPDLRYIDNDRTIGIEIVCCYPELDTSGSYNTMVCRTAEACNEYSKKLQQEGVRGIFALISFTDETYKPDSTVSTHRFKQIVIHEIARKEAQEKCERRLSTPEGRKEYIEKMASGFYDCKYVESVSWCQLQDSDIVEVSPTRTGYRLTLDAKYVQNCMEKKENKLLQYKEQSDNRGISEYWLFICIPISTFYDLEGFEMPPFQSLFDKVYITDSKRVLQLK